MVSVTAGGIRNSQRRRCRGRSQAVTTSPAHLRGPAGCRSAAEAWAHSIALARDRYSRLMKTAGSGMAGEPRSVMQGLVGEGDE